MSRHILILNRWSNEFGEYHRYVDHRSNRVAYLTTPAGREPLDEQLAEAIVTLPDLGDTAAVTTHAKELATRYGPFDHVIALSEFDLETAAELRAVLDVPGKTMAEVLKVRDKLVMKQHIEQAGLRVPAYGPANSVEQVRDLVRRVGLPIVLKPRAGADSQGVFVCRTEAELDSLLADESFTDYEGEQFVEGGLYQVDGVVQGGRLLIVRSWQCLAGCLDFAQGTPFGSVANDDAEFERRVVSYTERVLAALGITDDVFHLEFFRTDAPIDDDEHADMVFLEIGARAGGGQVRFVWRDVYGVDLIDASVKLHIGAELKLPQMDLGTVAGYLMMPEPPVRPAVVHSVGSLLGRVPDLFDETLPPPGAILNGTGGARHTAGTFRFRAPTADRVKQAISQAAELYELSWSPAQAEDDTIGTHG
ncbi:ATP-grasp domain-containing protein [Micromonospora sp. DT48]|uniref:ATP-grasp domain-containing protein n=1 Tax=unclassified Micromonospora TaxID=2617518 RepID=UPI0018AD1445|nr:ATP-grasp domain-containing protein [Micromonospora sp. CP22]